MSLNNFSKEYIIGTDIHYRKKMGQYIYTDNYNTNRAIVVNRITGSGKNAAIRAAIVNKKKWLAENHVNVIEKCNSIVSLESICEQIVSRDTLSAIRIITGNTQISKTELLNLVPFSDYKNEV